jgi:hypothetical protein
MVVRELGCVLQEEKLRVALPEGTLQPDQPLLDLIQQQIGSGDLGSLT